MLEVINNLRRYSLDKKPHIKKYYKIRKLHSEIINTMVRYYETSKFELKIDNDYISNNEHSFKNNEALHLIESSFDLETREGIQGLYDLLIYKSTKKITNQKKNFLDLLNYTTTIARIQIR